MLDDFAIGESRKDTAAPIRPVCLNPTSLDAVGDHADLSDAHIIFSTRHVVKGRTVGCGAPNASLKAPTPRNAVPSIIGGISPPHGSKLNPLQAELLRIRDSQYSALFGGHGGTLLIDPEAANASPVLSPVCIGSVSPMHLGGVPFALPISHQRTKKDDVDDATSTTLDAAPVTSVRTDAASSFRRESHGRSVEQRRASLRNPKGPVGSHNPPPPKPQRVVDDTSCWVPFRAAAHHQQQVPCDELTTTDDAEHNQTAMTVPGVAWLSDSSSEGEAQSG